eukprot:1141979-Pelagomonas_calceolata.AAC.5
MHERRSKSDICKSSSVINVSVNLIGDCWLPESVILFWGKSSEFQGQKLKANKGSLSTPNLMTDLCGHSAAAHPDFQDFLSCLETLSCAPGSLWVHWLAADTWQSHWCDRSTCVTKSSSAT